jgi:hypothetical protein
MEDQMKLWLKIGRVQKKTPYPEEVYSEPTPDEWQLLCKLLKDNNLNKEMFFGSFGRRVWERCIGELYAECENEVRDINELMIVKTSGNPPCWYFEVGCGLYCLTFVNTKDLDIKGASHFGFVDHEDFEIKIDKNLGKDLKESALWHEIIHCIEAMYGIDLPETVVAVLANEITKLRPRVQDILEVVE